MVKVIDDPTLLRATARPIPVPVEFVVLVVSERCSTWVGTFFSFVKSTVPSSLMTWTPPKLYLAMLPPYPQAPQDEQAQLVEHEQLLVLILKFRVAVPLDVVKFVINVPPASPILPDIVPIWTSVRNAGTPEILPQSIIPSVSMTTVPFSLYVAIYSSYPHAHEQVHVQVQLELPPDKVSENMRVLAEPPEELTARDVVPAVPPEQFETEETTPATSCGTELNLDHAILASLPMTVVPPTL